MHPLYRRWRAIHASAAYAQQMKEIIPVLAIPVICGRWSDDELGFQNFIEDIGLPPFPRAVLARKNFKLGWSRDNMHWTTKKEHYCNVIGEPALGWKNWLPNDLAEKLEKREQKEALNISKEIKL